MPRKTTTEPEHTEEDAEEASPKWQSRAVERSLERSRAAAEKRSVDFVMTALKLVDGRDGQDFTVQDIVTAMRISTRTFYQYFSSKEELLVAMFEEVQREHNRGLRALTEVGSGPLARIEAFVLGILRRAHETSRWHSVGRLLIQQFLQLQVSHPEELRQSYAGVLSYLSELVAEAADAGEIESTDHKRTAAIIMQTVVSASQASVIGSPLIDPPPTPEEVWQFCLNGIGAGREPASTPESKTPATPRQRGTTPS
jgi:AcrR family transcriptional regulator